MRLDFLTRSERDGTQLEVETNLSCNFPVAGAKTAAATATTARSKATEPTIQREALAKERRRQVADWWREIDVIEKVLKV